MDYGLWCPHKVNACVAKEGCGIVVRFDAGVNFSNQMPLKEKTQMLKNEYYQAELDFK